MSLTLMALPRIELFRPLYRWTQALRSHDKTSKTVITSMKLFALAIDGSAGNNECPKRIHYGWLCRSRGLAPIAFMQILGLLGVLSLGISTVFTAFDAAYAAGPQFAVAESIFRGLNNGQPQVVIVELEDFAIQAQAARYRRPDMPDIDPPEALAFKATRFMALKLQVTASLDMTDIEVTQDYSHLPMVAVKVSSTAALNRLLARPEIIAIHENVAHYPTLAESLPLIGQPTVAAAGYAGAGTTIAVIDSGTDYTRAAFGSCSAPGGGCKVVFARDFAADDGSRDDTGHGTNVAGIVLGVAPGAKIAALDVEYINIFNKHITSPELMTLAINYGAPHRQDKNRG